MTSNMNMGAQILAALAEYEKPMTSNEIVHTVHRISGIRWKRSSIQKALGRMVSRGSVRNLDRDPHTGNYRRLPCRYELAS